jgi:hypothetical protein
MDDSIIVCDAMKVEESVIEIGDDDDDAETEMKQFRVEMRPPDSMRNEELR